jgi:hypothetical protein
LKNLGAQIPEQISITFKIDRTTQYFEEAYFGPVKELVEPIEPSLRTIEYENTGRVNFATKVTYIPVEFGGPTHPLEIITIGDSFPCRETRCFPPWTKVVPNGCHLTRAKGYFEDIEEYYEDTTSPINYSELGLAPKGLGRPVIGFGSLQYCFDNLPSVKRVRICTDKVYKLKIHNTDTRSERIRHGSVLGKRSALNLSLTKCKVLY